MYRRGEGPSEKQRLEELSASARRDPSNPIVLAELAALELDIGELDSARKHLRAALLSRLDGLSITKAELIYRLALVEQRAGSDAKARVMLTRALESDPTHFAAKALLVALGT